jgi:hypothetical protein
VNLGCEVQTISRLLLRTVPSLASCLGIWSDVLAHQGRKHDEGRNAPALTPVALPPGCGRSGSTCGGGNLSPTRSLPPLRTPPSPQRRRCSRGRRGLGWAGRLAFLAPFVLFPFLAIFVLFAGCEALSSRARSLFLLFFGSRPLLGLVLLQHSALPFISNRRGCDRRLHSISIEYLQRRRSPHHPAG